MSTDESGGPVLSSDVARALRICGDPVRSQARFWRANPQGMVGASVGSVIEKVLDVSETRVREIYAELTSRGLVRAEDPYLNRCELLPVNTLYGTPFSVTTPEGDAVLEAETPSP